MKLYNIAFTSPRERVVRQPMTDADIDAAWQKILKRVKKEELKKGNQ